MPGSSVTDLAAVEGLQWSDDQVRVPPEVSRSSLAPGPTSRVQAVVPLFVTIIVRPVPAPTVSDWEAAWAATTMSADWQVPLAAEADADSVGDGESVAVAEALAEGDSDSAAPLAAVAEADGSALLLSEGLAESAPAGALSSGLAESLRDRPNVGPCAGSEAFAFELPVRAPIASHMVHRRTSRMTPRTARRRQ